MKNVGNAHLIIPPKNGWSRFSAKVAVQTLVIYVEFTGNILR